MHKVLAIKYRPKNFNGVIGQKIAVQTIINEIKLINKLFKPKSIAIIPNWDFEFIPLEFTYKKIRIMNQIKMKGKGINL